MKEDIRARILKLCEGQEWDWKYHIEQVVKHSLVLAEKLDADRDICEIAAWLHDIIKLEEGLDAPRHHIKGADRAVEILKEYHADPNLIEKVRHCIISHSCKEGYMPESKEAKILASADAMSHHDCFIQFNYLVYSIWGLPQEDGRAWLIKKYKKSWKKMIPEARELVQEKRDAINMILDT